MALMTWIVLGIIAGLVAHRRFNASGQGIFMDIVLSPGVVRNLLLGVGGGVLGGWATSSAAMTSLGTAAHAGAHSTPLLSLLVNHTVNILAALLSANLVLGMYHQIARRNRRAVEAPVD